MAKWNGTNWVRVSSLLGQGYAFSVFNSKLIIGGSFQHQNYSHVTNIMGWDGLDVDTSMFSFNHAIFKLKTYSDTLYAVGSFTGRASNPSNYISLYYNQSWHSIGSPIGGSNWILDVIKFENDLYLCGYFTNPPDLCRYNGSGFDSVADVLGYIQRLIQYKGDLYAGGFFSQLNGISINSIAKYNNVGNSIENNIYSKNDKITIYPNPCYNGKFQIFVNDNLNIKNISMDVYSIDGKNIYSRFLENPNPQNLKLELPEDHGVFILKLKINNSILYTEKLLCFTN